MLSRAYVQTISFMAVLPSSANSQVANAVLCVRSVCVGVIVENVEVEPLSVELRLSNKQQLREGPNAQAQPNTHGNSRT